MNNFYGFLTKKGKNIFLITLLSTALLFASCINDLFNDDKSSKKQETQTEQTEQTEQTGSEELIPVKINISNQKQIENILQKVKPQKNISQARAASPQNVTLKYKILYKKVTDTSQSSCELTDSSAVLQLSKGTWDFTLIAYFNEIVLFTGDVLNQPINSGKENSLTFTLKEVEGKGNLVINLIIPKSNEYTTEVKVQLKTYPSLEAIAGFDQTALTPANTGTTEDTYIYSKNDIQNGMYFAVFTITTKNSQAASESQTAANSTETTVYPVPVRVVTNLTSESEETLTKIRNVCVITYDLGTDGTVSWTAAPERVYTKYQNVTLPTYEKLAPLQTKIFNGWKDQDGKEVTSPMNITQNVTLQADWITTTLYVDRSSTETEPDALKESTAVKTLQDAVNKLVTYEALDDGDDTSYQHEWTINVNGTCYGTSWLLDEELNPLQITKLTITGDDNAQDILDGRTSATGTATDAVITFDRGNYTQNEGTYPLYIENLTIQNGSHTAGGGLNITDNTTYLNNVILIDNTASDNGGAIALTQSKLFIYGGTKIGQTSSEAVAATDTACSNRAGKKGGGIYADENSTIYFGYTAVDEPEETLPTNSITYNYAGSTVTNGGGGGIYCLGKLYTNGGTISYNSAAYGGGINTFHLSMKGSNVSNNTATATFADGGGIFIQGTSETVSVIKSAEYNGNNYLTTISNNSSKMTGGGISFSDGALYISGTSISSNKATSYGGGIYVPANSSARLFLYGTTTIGDTPAPLTFADDSNYSNTAGCGGGIYISENSSAYINYSSEDDPEHSGDVKINYNYASSSANNEGGGGIYAEKNSKLYIAKGTTINYNAGDKGGGIFGNGNTTYMSGGTIYGNNASLSGGGIYLAGLKIDDITYYGTLYMYDEAKIGTSENPNSAQYGGGIYIDSLSKVYLGDSGIDGENKLLSGGVSYNKAFDPDYDSFGGGIYNKGLLQVSSGSISNNISKSDGGGVYNETDAKFYMYGGTIASNTAVNGGGVYNLSNADFSMTGATIESNKANSSGGGIYTTNLSMKGSTVSNNVATGEGGGIFINSSSTTKSSITSAEFDGITTSTVISGNTSSSNGGGISFTDGELYISGTTICDNKATSNGGGIYVGSGTSARLFLFGTTTIGAASASSFATEDYKSNSATNGGGIYLGSSTQAYLNYTSDGIIDESGAVNITYNYTKFGNNDYGGGGIYAENNSKLYIAKGTTINYNEGTKGGGIFGNGNTTYMSGGTIYGNDAKYGGGIYLAGTDEYKGTLYMYGEAKIGTPENLIYDSDNAIYYSNGASYGGGIYIDVHSQAYLGYSGINEKNNLTGGVYFNCAFKATATVTGVGGGVYNYGILWMSSGNISHNTSQNSGGGVYNLPNAEFSMTGGAIESNTAKNGGGVYNKGIFHVSSGNIKSNTVSENGGGIYTDPANSTDETILENSEITENTAVDGGGVYIAAGHLDIKSATIFKENKATGKGGAIGGEETYYINIEDQGENAYAYIEPDPECNDIYLNTRSSINLYLRGNTLSPDHDYIARFTPYEYVANVQFIDIYEGDYDSYKKFKVTPQKETDTTEVEWETTSDGKIQKKP